MTPSEALAISQTNKKDEILFPQGEFWSDEPPLESDLEDV
jgi:hypothetical protein